METLLEKTLQRTNVEQETQQQHNAQISERYRKLLSAENDQFSEQDVVAPVEEVRASVFVEPQAVEAPVAEQTPQVTEFTHERLTSPVFTTEKFERLQEQAPVVAETIPVYAPVREQKAKETTVVAAQYSLSPLAKLVMAVFAFVVLAMLTMICVNTRLMQTKSIRIQNLEERRQELMEQNEELQSRIAEAKSEESVRAWAEEHGMVQGN